MYTALKATVASGRIELLEPITLSENSDLLVVVLSDEPLLTLGQKMIASLESAVAGRYTSATTQEELDSLLDDIFNEMDEDVISD